MKKITVSAPGKLMLFGEHAVVYGHPCIVTAVDQRLYATVEIVESGNFELNAPDVKVFDFVKPMEKVGAGEVLKGAQFIESAVKNFIDKYKIKSQGLKITTRSEFSQEFGFGSSSASAVCVIKALDELYKFDSENKDIFELAYKAVFDVQGKGSGFDVAASVYGGTLYFVIGGKVIDQLKITKLPLVIGYSGIKADTVTLINKVLEKQKKFPEIVNGLYDNIEDIVELSKSAIVNEDWQTVGELMNLNQGILESLGVGSNRLSGMIYGARDEGAFGAKLSGAGGGDCMIAVCSGKNMKSVQKGIGDAGGTIMKVKTNAEGVRVEEKNI